MLLEQARQDVRAHKALLITAVGFQPGAEAVAKDKEIALHIVRPDFDVAVLPGKDREAIQKELASSASKSEKPIYTFEIVTRGLVLTQGGVGPQPPHGPGLGSGSVPIQTRVVAPPNPPQTGGVSNKMFTGGETKGGSAQGFTTRDCGGGIQKR